MEKLYEPKELAERWDVTYRTVLNSIKRGEIKAFKVGKKYKVKESEVTRVENVLLAEAESRLV